MEANQRKNKMTTKQENENESIVLPGLPNDIARSILSSLPATVLFSVCHSWRRLLYSPSFPPFFSLYAILSPPNHNNSQFQDLVNTSVQFLSFNPISSTWESLPYPPTPLHLLHRHPSFLSRKLPIQSLTVSNHLVLISGASPGLVPALSKPLIFNPDSNRWFFGPKFSIPRRWCATGSMGGTIYLASGVGSQYNGDVARSMEKWEMIKEKRESWKWEKMAALKDGRFSREAVEAIGWKGKLCMVNVKGNAPKDGWVYDVLAGKWGIMPEGMIAGWTGPAATMNEEIIYAVDELTGVLREYDSERDCWREVVELPELKNAEHMAAGRGKVCVVCANGERIVVVDVVVAPARSWVVEPPFRQQVVSVHVLPRISKQLVVS